MTEVFRRVIEVDVQADPRWEAFLHAHPDGLIYHHPAWLQALERENGCKTVALICEDDHGRVQGLLPLVSTRGLPFMKGNQFLGRRLSSLPRTPIAGPLALDNHAMAALVQAAVERVSRMGNLSLQLKAGSPELGGLVADVMSVPYNISYSLELPERVEELRFGNSRNHARIKWAVGKAAKLGVKVRLAETEDDLRGWYRLYLDTMRHFAVPPRPYRFFADCYELLRPRGLMRLLLAEHDHPSRRKLLAGSIYLMFGRTVFYAFNGRDRQELGMRPNDALQWQAIHDACREGFRYFDFGEVEEDNPGLADFKEKWGAQPKQLYRYYFPVKRAKTPDHATRGTNQLYQVGSAVWQKLPLPVTSVLGDLINRYR